MEKWKLISSKYIHKAPWATLRKDTVELPSGLIKEDYYVLEYPDWVNVVALTSKGEFIMIRQYRHGAQEIMLELPAGVIDPGETPKEAVARELLEETGYSAGSLEPLCELYPNPASSGNISHSFLARDCFKTSAQNLDSTEDIEVELFSEQEILDLIARNKIPQALHVGPLFYALKTLDG